MVVASEFGRTIANQPKAGVEPIGFAEQQSGDELLIESEKMYGFHGHFSSANCMLFFGGGFKPGLVYGRTADRHPMLPIENPVTVTDVHATIYQPWAFRPIRITSPKAGRFMSPRTAAAGPSKPCGVNDRRLPQVKIITSGRWSEASR